MKISIDIDCTPQELRTFFGLPDIEPMQDALVARMQQRLATYLDAAEPETLMRIWLPGGLEGLGQMQERFWSQFMSGLTGAASPGATKSKKPKE
jgi:Tfp pilus assembly PilM family ATPase